MNTTFQPALVLRPPGDTVQQRRRPRVLLSLPVRLRWLGPFSQRTEVSETLDVSRGGLLIRRHEFCRPGTLVWVTFPFDAALRLAQPETPARVVRLAEIPHGFQVALEFESSPKRGAFALLDGRERRAGERIRLALPVRMRPADSPFPEQTMTADISGEGLLLWTLRLYQPGDTVLVSFPCVRSGFAAGRWTAAEEAPARVVRMIAVTLSVEQQVAIARLPLEARPERSSGGLPLYHEKTSPPPGARRLEELPR